MRKRITLAELSRSVAAGATVRRVVPEQPTLDEIVAATLARMPVVAPVTTVVERVVSAPVVIPTPIADPVVAGDVVEDMTYDERGRLRLKFKGGRMLEVRIAGTSTVVQAGADLPPVIIQDIIPGPGVIVDKSNPIAPVIAVDLPAGGGGGVESRYETYSDESVVVTRGRIMFMSGGLLNGSGILNGGRIIEAQQL